MTDAYIGDVNGNPVGSCNVPDQTDVSVWLNMDWNSAANRYCLRLWARLVITNPDNSQITVDLEGQLLAQSISSQNTLLKVYDFAYLCGQTVEIVAHPDYVSTNMGPIFGWQVNNDNSCDNTGGPNFVDCSPPGQTACEQNIIVNPPLQANFSYVAECDGNSFQKVTFTDETIGGDGNYTYSWDFDVSTNTASPATSNTAGPHSVTYSSGGTRTVKLTVMNGGESSEREINIEVESCCSGLTCSTTPTDASCHGGRDGKITVTAGGGTPGYTYSIDGGQNYQASNEFTGLMPGNYTITIKDANGCTKTCDEVTIGQPDALTCSTTPTDASCHGGSDGKITVTAGGGTSGYTYSIDGGQNYQASNEFTELTAGNYTITIKDANGCTKICDEVTVGEPDALSCEITETHNVGCDGSSGIITVTPTGGTGTKMYKLDNGSFQASNTFTGLSAETYTVTVKDANDCTSTCDITLDPLDPPHVNIVKEIESGPVLTGNMPNEYSITYLITVNNTGTDCPGTYDLSDTLKYGAGATITDVTVSYVGVEGTTGTANYTNFDGQSDYKIIDDEQVGAGKEDVFQIVVTFEVDPAKVTSQSADCELTGGEEGTGLLNIAEVSDGVPSKRDDACADMPNPSVDIVKTVTAGPTSTGNVNEYTMTYQVEVSNTSDALAFYDLSDTLK
ncbi:hypothetical protein KUV50_19215, partial [Membranicola marinus]|nr:hypothetical protein [Membranihabitans marinus]